MAPDPVARTELEVGEGHHALTVHEAVLWHGSDLHAGLTAEEAAVRRHRFGPNVLPEATGTGRLVRLGRQLNHPLIYILLVSAAVTFLLGEVVDGSVILGVVVINALVGYVQESKAEQSLDALRSLLRTEARVVRDGREQTVPSAALVPGDIVLVEAGDKVPADLRLLEVHELEADESALTGESLPVVKDEVVMAPGTPVADRRNMLHSATLVTRGSASGLVVATGVETEIGEIHRLVGSATPLATPLTRKLGRFSTVLTVVILGLAAVTFAVGVLRGEAAGEMMTAAVALAVGAIPEGLPAAVTITLAIGVSRMARRRAVVRRMPAVETLGSTTVICSDKTGTLTENQMTVRAIWTPSQRCEVTGSGYRPEGELLDRAGEHVAVDADAALSWSLRTGVACSDADLEQVDDEWSVAGDPTEGAMLVAAAKAGIGPDELASDLPRLATFPFSSERGYMATVHDAGGAARVVLVKGAVERVLELCDAQMAADGSSEPLQVDQVHRDTHALADQGLRVLATASGHVEGDAPVTVASLTGTLVLTGLQAMLDPPRPAATAAVAACQRAGIAVKMITGDHAATAAAIARQLGILDADATVDDDSGRVLTGAHLATVADDLLPEVVEGTQVFARVSPEQKLRLVEALQSRQHVVAMTGDGVNDAPALQQADIGVAMGRGGTEVAKEAADMVLLDDEFATIEAAVEEGRGVFDNLSKFIVWTLPTNLAEGLVILTAILVGAALPILPVQILWINMTTAILLGLMLAFEPKEAGIMQRPPRPTERPLLTRPLIMRIVLVSTLLVGGSWWLFESELGRGASLAEARTAALNVFVVVEAVYLFSCRSLTEPSRRLGLLSNRWILGGVGLQAVGQIAITYLGVMNTIFDTAPIDGATWLRIAAIAFATSLVVALDKRLRRFRL